MLAKENKHSISANAMNLDGTVIQEVVKYGCTTLLGCHAYHVTETCAPPWGSACLVCVRLCVSETRVGGQLHKMVYLTADLLGPVPKKLIF